MNTVVGKLLDTDRQARQLLDDARQYYEKTIEEIGKEKEHLLQKYTEKAEKHLEDVRRDEASAADEAITAIKSDSGEKNRVMEEIFQKNHGAWENEIFARCVKRVDRNA